MSYLALRARKGISVANIDIPLVPVKKLMLGYPIRDYTPQGIGEYLGAICILREEMDQPPSSENIPVMVNKVEFERTYRLGKKPKEFKIDFRILVYRDFRGKLETEDQKKNILESLTKTLDVLVKQWAVLHNRDDAKQLKDLIDEDMEFFFAQFKEAAYK